MDSMKEILQEYQSSHVKSSANKAQRHGDYGRRVFDDFREFHVVLLCYVVDNVSEFPADVLSDKGRPEDWQQKSNKSSK